MVELILVVLCAVLWRLGGSDKFPSWTRDTLIPIIIGLYFGITLVWWVGVITGVSFLIIRIGYGTPDATDDGSSLGQFVYHKLGIKKPWVVRGLAGLIYGVIGGACVFIYTQQYYLWLLYASVNFMANALGEKMKWNVNIVEPLAGLAVGLIFLLK